MKCEASWAELWLSATALTFGDTIEKSLVVFLMNTVRRGEREKGKTHTQDRYQTMKLLHYIIN